MEVRPVGVLVLLGGPAGRDTLALHSGENKAWSENCHANHLGFFSRCVAALTAHKSLRLAAVREHEVVLSIAKFLWPARHEHIIVPEEILQAGQLKHTHTHTGTRTHKITHTQTDVGACVPVWKHFNHIC